MWKKDLGKSPDADILETSNGNIIYAAAISDKSSYSVLLVDNNGEDLKTILEFKNESIRTDSTNYSSTTYSSNGRILFNIDNDSLFVLNKRVSTTTDGINNIEDEILLYIIDSDGNIINNVIIDGYTTYGITVENDISYLFSYNNTNDKYYIIKLSSSLEYTIQELDLSSLTDSEKENIDSGKFTSLVTDNSNLYFATTYGIYEVNMSSYEVNLKVIGERSSNEVVDYTSLDILNGYFIAGGVTKDDNDYTIALAIIYDINFNEIGRININEIFDIESSSSFSIIKGITVVSDGFIINGMLTNRAFIIKYAIPFNIYTITDGNGIIEISSEIVYSNTEVSFVLTPNDGYELDTLTITDSLGNIIDYTSEYTFIMPKSNITIEVSFINNPNTSSIIIVLVAFIGIMSTILFIKNKNKLKHLT